MKASLKFREEQRPLLRAKVPLSIVGMPFQSGIVAGDSKELSLNLATFFDSGPSLKLSYRPNDASSPFSVVLETGTGAYGSPRSSPFLMSAEFNFLGRGTNNNNNPSFMLHFKPRFGDFSIRKSQSSVNGAVSGGDDSIEVVDAPAVISGKKFSDFVDAGSICGFFSGVEASARTAIPVNRRTAVNLRWGVTVPAEGKGLSVQKVPYLVLNKIGIEHVDGGDSKAVREVSNADVADTCMGVKRQLDFLQAENGLLRRAVEDLRHEIAGRKSALPAVVPESGKYDRRSNEKVKSTEGDASKELKKALMGATGSGV